MKKSLLILLLISTMSNIVKSQCVGTCSNYSVTSIPFATVNIVGGNSLFLQDDDLSSPIPIGFNFNYMCNTYSTCLVSSNGFITLNPLETDNGCCSGGFLPDAFSPNGVIAAFWTDLYPPGGGSITYTTVGTAPYRKFIVYYNAIPICCGSTDPHTGQIILYEANGAIEIHTTDIPNSGNVITQGIENVTGTIGFASPGLNSVFGFSGTNFAYRFQDIVPTAPGAISGPSLVCANATAIYTINTLPGATSYMWMLPSGWVGTSTTNTISVTTGAAGTLSVSAIYACGASTFSTKSVSITPSPTITVNSGTVCSGQSFTMVPSGASSYTFSSGSAVVTPTATTSYTVIATNSLGCSGFAVSTVSINNSLLINVNSGLICSGSSFTILPSGASSYTFSSGSAVVTPTATTNYTVVGTNSLGCSGSAVSNVSVNASPTITVNSGLICNGGSFTLVPSGASSYTFSSGSAVVSPTTNTSYTVVGTSSLGCVSSINAVSNVTVIASNVSIVSSATSVCSGQSATLTASGASSYTWSPGTQTTSVIVITPTVSSIYTVTAGSGTCIGTAVKSMSVKPSPVVLVSPVATTICSTGASATLTASGSTSYSWTPTNFAGPPNIATIVVSPSVNTIYTVASNSLGCIGTNTVSVSLISCVGIEKNSLTLKSSVVYPNPTTGLFTIELQTNATVTISDALGKIIYLQKLQSGKQLLNLTNFKNGLYILKTETNGIIRTNKIIKE